MLQQECGIIGYPKLNHNVMRYEDVKGYEGLYYVTETGEVYAYTRLMMSSANKAWLVLEHKIKQAKKNGYLKVALYKYGKAKMYYVHRLVAEAFLENAHNLPMVNHKDLNRSNNNLSNLEYCTARYNNVYSALMGKHSSKFLGVTWDKNRCKWMAQYQVGKRKIFLGRFDTQEEAHEKYEQAMGEYEKCWK